MKRRLFHGYRGNQDHASRAKRPVLAIEFANKFGSRDLVMGGKSLPVTIRDIAVALGVSPSTVSQALNNKGQLRPQTRERVRMMAAKLGYDIALDPIGPFSKLTGRFARVVLYSTSSEVSVETASTFAMQVIRGIEEAMTSFKIVPILCSESSLQREGPRDLVGTFCVGGVLSDESARYLEASGLPVITVGCQCSATSFATVEPDYVLATRLAVHHLARCGHRRIALLNGSDQKDSSDHKLTGFIRGMDDWSLPVRYVSHPPPTPELRSHRIDEIRTLLQGEWREVSAIICAYEHTSLNTIQCANELALSVPGDVSIVSCHDFGSAQDSMPPLTTVAVSPFQLGKLAVSHLLSLVSNPGLIGTRLVVRPSLTVRGSSGPPAHRT